MSNRKFKTEEEAQHWLDLNRVNCNPLLGKFCPVIRDTCKSNCVCFSKPKIQKRRKSYGREADIYYQVTTAYCSFDEDFLSINASLET